MSRFPEASVACLKQVMLSRAPEFYFRPEDEPVIGQRTGLNSAQIMKWAELFRYRYKTEKERMEFLTSDGSEKVTEPHTLAAVPDSKEVSISMYFAIFILF